MLRVAVALLLAALVWATAQIPHPRAMGMMQAITFDAPQHGGGGSFVGVADQETTVVHFWGLVAASAAKATANVNAIDLSNNSTTCTAVKVLSTGQLDVSSGLYCNGGTQTVTTWCSTNCAVSSSDTVARITTLYDQIGSVNLTQAYATAPGFVLSGVSSKPTGMCVQARSSTITGTITSISSPFSAGSTMERYNRFTSFGTLQGVNGDFFLGNYGATNSVWIQAVALSSTQISGVTDGTSVSDFSHFHRVLWTIPTSTGTSDVYVDGGAPSTASTTGGNLTGTAQQACGSSSGFADVFFTNYWLDNTQPNSTVGEAVTNLTTVPLP